MGANQPQILLGEFLRARRGLVTVDRVGMPGGGYRRVPGLRREEVASLAGISVDYYRRLERGVDRDPSFQVLQSLSQVLQLDELETQYLFNLVSPALPNGDEPSTQDVPAHLRLLLDAVGLPAFIENRDLDILAHNPQMAALNPRATAGNNRLLATLLDPAEREFHVEWEQTVVDLIALFRSLFRNGMPSARAREIVARLSTASVEFRTLWSRHDVRMRHSLQIQLDHPDVGRLELYREKLEVDDLLVIAYHPDPGSTSEARLHALT